MKSTKPKARVRETIVLQISGGKIAKSGDIDSSNNIHTNQGHKIVFQYPYPPEIFALFILKFTPQVGVSNNDETPFNAKVYITDSGELSLNVKQSAKKGSYDYRLALLDTTGKLFTEDPQIIVQ